MSAAPGQERGSEPDADDPLVDELRELFREALNFDVPSPQTDLIEAGLLDSLALVELLFQIEQRFAIDLALEELEVDNFRTIERLAAEIRQQGAGTER